MQRDERRDIIHFGVREQHAADLPESASVAHAPAILNNLMAETRKYAGYRQAVRAAGPYEMHPAYRQTRLAKLEDRLITLHEMKQRLGELAAAEIIQASLEGASEFKGLIDFTRLHGE